MTDLWSTHSPVPDRPDWYFGSVRRTWDGGACRTEAGVYRTEDGVTVARLSIPMETVGRPADPQSILDAVREAIDAHPDGLRRDATVSAVDPDA